MVAVPVGGGAVLITGALPWDAVDTWAQRHGLGRAESSVLVTVLRKLDVGHARRESERLQAAARAAAGKR